MTSSDFASLSARAQALRLRRLALAALEHYDLQAHRVRLLSHSYNTLFRVDTLRRRYVLRINLPGVRGLGQIEAEMAWLAALRRDTDLSVPLPLANRSGKLVTTVSAPDVPEPRHCAVFSWLEGPLLADRLSPETMRQLGAITARLHRHSLHFRLPPGASLKRLDQVLFGNPAAFFAEEYRALFPQQRLELFQAGLERVRACLAELYAQPVAPQVLHADLHQRNLKLYKGRLAILDFDDCALGYPVQDLAITLYYLVRQADFSHLRQALREGYEQEAAWPETQLGQIDTLIAGRGLDLANFILTSPNPDWRAAGAQFVERTEALLKQFLAWDS